MKPVLGGVAAVLVLAGAGVGWIWLGPESEGPGAAESADLRVEGNPTELGVRDGIDFNQELDIELPDVAADDEEGDAAAPSHIGKTFRLEPFVVNIADRERDRFLKLKAEIELSEPEVAAEMEQRLPQIRDLVISLLGAKSFEEIRTIEGKNFLREEILLRVNALLVTGKAKRVFFTEFVVQ